MRFVAFMCVMLASVTSAAERHWQVGTWADAQVSREMVDFGPGSTPFDRGRPAPTMRAMADVRVYVIETDGLRLELKEVVKVNKRSIDVVVGEPVTFALEKKSVYVRGAGGIEHRLRVTKQTVKTPS